MFANFGPGHWAVLAVVVILLFGAKKLPEAARALGKSMRIFKSEVRELQNEGKSETPAPPPTTVQSERVEPPATPPTEQSQQSQQSHTDARPA
ncbi:Sec-independent protein translocase subunit TatA [Mycobacterium sp.]|jgi:sec-independent protein translocase protein TatA|uniref:Sec-independent protein translocase subunit TatA n=1 Tax=Mycobacterium sp. TaxID=1785 RepID=UPI002D486248|nr:Sec-independent protein translocase subunit TatA [Mycobacterium sp.]HZA10765.1 Sec-independent protein translocase subunit TatA [Mycobacterium sp.]